MLDFKEIKNPEEWELFARDFLQLLGFFVESSPDRGPDGGKDILITEQLEGKIGQYKFRWLVSCKHNAVSNISVSETVEQNILERVAGFNADGFIGFYSTVASSGLNNRLKQLREAGRLKDYRIFEQKQIENFLITLGFSKLLMRYFPEGYKVVKPLHVIFDKYYPLNCEICGRDLLEDMYHDNLNGIIQFVGENKSDHFYMEDIHIVCKDICDRKMEAKVRAAGHKPNGWEELKDLVISPQYLKFIMATLNNLQSGKYKYSEHAFKKEKFIIMKLGQKALREMNVEEQRKVALFNEFDI